MHVMPYLNGFFGMCLNNRYILSLRGPSYFTSYLSCDDIQLKGILKGYILPSLQGNIAVLC